MSEYLGILRFFLFQSAADKITDKNRIMAAVDCTAPGNNGMNIVTASALVCASANM